MAVLKCYFDELKSCIDVPTGKTIHVMNMMLKTKEQYICSK